MMQHTKNIIAFLLVWIFLYTPFSVYGQAASSTNSTSTETVSTKGEVQGMEMCIKAARLSAKFGGFTALDRVQESVLDSVRGYLSLQFNGATGLNIDFSNLGSSIISEGLGMLNNVFGNILKDKIGDQVDALKKKAQEKLEKIAKDAIDSVVGKATDAVSALDPTSPVPVAEKGDLLKEAQKQNKKISESIAEQRRAQLTEDTRDKCRELLKTTTETIKRSLLYQLSNQLTQWIVNDEKPQFIKDPGQFLKDTAQLAVDRTISRIAPRLCEPFQLSITAQIPTTNRQANPFYEELTCTLDQITGNIESFYNDFRNGGWIAYQEMWKPQNNYYGASMMVQEELARQQAAATQLANADLQRGSGFPSQTQCTEWRLYVPTECNLNDLQKRMSDILQVGGTCYEFDGQTVGYDVVPPDSSNEGPNTFWACERSEVTNPGTVTARLGEKAQQMEVNQLETTDDIENFLDTIGDAIVSKLVKSGIGGLRGLLQGLPPLNL